MELLTRFEGRELYIAECLSLSACDPTPPGAPYWRLLVLAKAGQLDERELRGFASRALQNGAYAMLAAGSAADEVEQAFDEAIVDERYESGGRSFVTAVSRQGLVETLWEAFYSMAGDADIEEDMPPIVVVALEGDELLPELRGLAGRLQQAFDAIGESRS